MEERIKDFIRIEATLVVIIILLTCLSLYGCTKTEYVTVEKIRTDTTYITKHQRDSVYLHDSISVKEKGDTVKIEKWHTKYVEKQVHDTLYQSKTDSIPAPYPVTEYVEKNLSTWQVVLMTIGTLTLMCIIVFVAIKLRRFLPCR